MSQSPTTIPAVDVRTAHDRCTDAESGPLLVDVREATEFETVRAEGAVLVPMSTFTERMNDLPKDRAILVICQSGNRSAAVTGHLLRNGWTDVANVTGGTGEWEKAGLPVRRGTPAPGEGDLPG